MGALTYRRLEVSNPVDVRQLQDVFESALGYFEMIQGHGPSADEARADLIAVPDGYPVSGLHYFLIELAGKPVGCLSVYNGYPDANVAYIGLLLFIDSHQGKGLGPKAIEFAQSLAGQWGCRVLRLSVVETNSQAHSFWLRQGFSESARKVHEQYGPSVVMDRPLGTQPGSATPIPHIESSH